ncbi:ABC transporter substrate-binding protein [Intestinibacter sp.]
MKKFKSLVLMLVAILSLVVLTGCSKNNESSDKLETRVVETSKGEVEIPANPERIVDISGSSEELAILGYTPVGTANVDSYDTENVPSYMADTFKDIKVVGHSMNDTMDIEAIIETNPDLIIMAPRQEKMYEELKEIAPVVMLEDYSNDWEANLNQVAKLFNKEDEAKAWLDDYYAEAKEIGNKIKATKGDESYVVALATSGQFMIFSEGGMGTILKDDMGLKQPENMPKQDSITLPTVSIEGLSEIDADNIVVIGMESDKQDLAKDSVFNEIRAVKEGNYVFLNASPFFSQAYNPMGRQLLLQEVKDALI